MAPVYADHPFQLLQTPVYLAQQRGEKVRDMVLCRQSQLAYGVNATDSYMPAHQTDMFDDIAAEMVHVHNMIIRGLNSIYLQAPHIKPADEKAFCKYMLTWHTLLHAHHDGEEEMLFPFLEKATGVKGIMDANLNQHKAFHEHLDSLKNYAEAVLGGTEKFSGDKIVAIVDALGPVLTRHLNDEIPTLLGLRQYADKLADLPKLFEDEGQKVMKEIGGPGMVYCAANIDMGFEGGMWTNFPPAPAPVKAFVRNILWWVHPECRKFASVDRSGKLRPLYAVPQEA
jgi:hemerythrin-like domain-containing protein